MAWNSDSLEAQNRIQSLLITLLSLSLAALIGWLWPYWWVWLSVSGVFMLIIKWQQLAGQRTTAALRRSSVQLEAMQNQDYSLQAKAVFQTGIAAQLQQQLQQLSEQLQQRKSHFDEQQFLLYRLIDQLNTPILVFDHKQQLSYANNEFSQLFGRPWQSMRHASAKSLGLSAKPQWNIRNAGNRYGRQKGQTIVIWQKPALTLLTLSILILMGTLFVSPSYPYTVEQSSLLLRTLKRGALRVKVDG